MRECVKMAIGGPPTFLVEGRIPSSLILVSQSVTPIVRLVPYISLDSVAANRVQTYEISSNPLSNHSKGQFRHWMDTCRKNHSRCPRDTKSLPKRVIDVQVDNLKLLDPSPSSSHSYVALSHCWGSCRDFLSTRENFEDRKAGFILEDLPATFRDAVLATRALDIPYLWIDSVCILQGDKEDWELEGSKMADIYSNAAITICATNSNDDAEGFVRTRRRLPTATIDIICPASPEYGNKERSTRFYVHDQDHSITNNDYLSERAWCLQERYLSPRILSFEERAIGWECFEATWYDTQREGHSSGLSLFADRDNVDALHIKWAEMVEHYSRRALTYTTDTLPALSAVAARAAQATGDQYLAGLWRNNILRWLLWRVVRYAGGFNRPENPARSEIYHAPSWSWASYAGSVKFQAPLSEEKYQTFDLVTVVDAIADVAGKNKFGSVDEAKLILRAPVLNFVALHCTKESPEEDWQGYQSHIVSCPSVNISNERIKVQVDYPGEKLSGNIHGVVIAHHGGAIYSKNHVTAGNLEEGASEAAVRNLSIVYGLLVKAKPSAGRRIFERVGIFQIGWIPLDWFIDVLGRMQMQDVEIV